MSTSWASRLKVAGGSQWRDYPAGGGLAAARPSVAIAMWGIVAMVIAGVIAGVLVVVLTAEKARHWLGLP